MKNRFYLIVTTLALILTLSLAARASTPAAELRRHFYDDVEYLAGLSAVTLEGIYSRAEVPNVIPSGKAVGTHVIPGKKDAPYDSKAKLPFVVNFAALKLWRSKLFNADTRIMKDKVRMSPDTRAWLYIDSLDRVMSPRSVCGSNSAGTWGDGRGALITDYTAIDNWPVRVQWIDELREVKPGIWLGRSFYACKFWGYVILRFK